MNKLIALALLPFLFIVGCTGGQTAAELIQVLVPVIDLIVNQTLGSGAAKLNSDFALLEKNFASFQAGVGSVAEVEEVLNDISSDLSALPTATLPTSTVLDIQLAIATVESIINILKPSSVVPSVVLTDAKDHAIKAPQNAKEFAKVRSQLHSGVVRAHSVSR